MAIAQAKAGDEVAARGVLFAVDDTQAERLATAQGDEAIRAWVADIEEAWDRDWLLQTDKAWDAIHRSLTDGRLLYANGSFPLNRCILGGVQLAEEDHFVVSVTPESEVPAVAEALETVSREGWSTTTIPPPQDYAHKSDADFDYTWANFRGLPEFYEKAAAAGRAVVFTVDL